MKIRALFVCLLVVVGALIWPGYSAGEEEICTWRGKASLKYADSATYFVAPATRPGEDISNSYGAALDLKYFSGLSYQYIKKILPGKKIHITVYIPEEALSSDDARLGIIRFYASSNKNGDWVSYYGDIERHHITRDGNYEFVLAIPEGPVTVMNNKTFYPDEMVLLTVEYLEPQAKQNKLYVPFSFSGFRIEGFELNDSALRWCLVKDGYVQDGVFLACAPAGSTLVYAMGNEMEIACALKGIEAQDTFTTVTALLPKELCNSKGNVKLSITKNGSTKTSSRDFSTCDPNGRIFISVPLDVPKDPALPSNPTLKIDIESDLGHDMDMPPIALERAMLGIGKIVPFDNKWRIRDVQGLGGYERIGVRKDGTVLPGELTFNDEGDNVYQITATIPLKGGVDWTNPHYRVEIMRDFGEPKDMEDQRIEVTIDPQTDVTDVWQKPFRARMGLLDTNGKVMFGPNVSLSEGLQCLAYLDVTASCPVPKGMMMPGFDLKKVKAILINFEAAQTVIDIKDLKLALSNVTIKPIIGVAASPVSKFDFSAFNRDPDSWQLRRLVKESGGFLIGVNYPFPQIKVPHEVLEVPQVYPTVGMKPFDPMPLGFSGDLTQKTAIRDFKDMLDKDIKLTRIFIFGHLDGVFSWDRWNRYIEGFAAGMESELLAASAKGPEEFRRFLRANESKLFPEVRSRVIAGLEHHVMLDLIGLLEILEQVEKDSGKRLMAVISLYDFTMADNIKKEGPLRKYLVGEHPEVVIDPLTRVKAQAIVWGAMKTMAQDERFYKYIAAVEFMNEPENSSALATKENFQKLVYFVGEGLYLLKDAIGPKVPVSVGFRGWYYDLAYWKAVAGGIDILMPHYWESFESYNVDKPGLWSLDTPADELWETLGEPKAGRLTGLGEISPQGNLMGNIERLKKADYDFMLTWAYIGHDGYDVKPYLGLIKERISKQENL
ncbi:MAG: hypothetical protein NTZ95_04020 [Candidatus Omnitrophica bacterium]|nr:hypothetical protein [Candidatus Omnitrophota bacterium]